MPTTTTYGPLGHYLDIVLTSQALTPEDLRQRLNLSGHVIKQLFYYGEQANIRQPKPWVVQAVAALLSEDKNQLLELAGYEAKAVESAIEESLEQAVNLGELLETVLKTRGLSSNRLAELAGVSQGTIHNLLRQGRDQEISGPHPRVLRSVCEVLGLDQLKVFQLVGYIDPNYEPVLQTPLVSAIDSLSDLDRTREMQFL